MNATGLVSHFRIEFGFGTSAAAARFETSCRRIESFADDFSVFRDDRTAFRTSASGLAGDFGGAGVAGFYEVEFGGIGNDAHGRS